MKMLVRVYVFFSPKLICVISNNLYVFIKDNNIKTMKIIQLSYSLASGGGERFVVDLCNRLAENHKNEVILLTTDDDRIPKNVHYLADVSPKVRFINLHCSSGFAFKSFWGVCRVIRKEKPDVVHAHCNLLLLLLPALFFHRVMFVHTLHNLAEVCLQFKWMKGLYRWLYRHRIQPITISKTCQQSYINLYGDKRAICITNGREPFVSTGNWPSDVLFLKESVSPVFIHVARCNPQKNQPRLFRAFDRLEAEGVKFHLLVLGLGYEDEWLPRYKNNHYIHILGVRKNVADYMALADFFVLSSDFEGLPLSLLEAMSMGVVPVCTPAGGVVDVLENGKNGYCSSSFADDDFYKSIKQALNERGKLNKDIIKKDYEDNYSMKVCSQKYYNVYEKIVNHEL